MGKDKIVKLIADTKQYESGIEQARKTLNKFSDANLSSKAALDAITGTLKNFVGVAALAKGAQEVFTRVIAGSNDATDNYEKMMRKINTSVDSFFTGIATGDFSIFENGLSNIAAKAAAAADAIDKLGNADMSFSYFQSSLSADFQEQVNVMREKDSTDAEKAAAKSKASSILAELEDIKASYVKTADDALAKVMTETSVLSSSGVSRLDLDKILRLDVSTWGDAKKEELRKQYAEFINEDKRLKKELQSTQESIPMGNGQWQTVTKKGYEEQSTAIIEARKANQASHQEAILYNETLVKKSDQWLKDLIAIAQKSDAARREYEGMLKTYNKVTGNASSSMTSNSKGSKGGSTIPTPVISLPAISPISQEQLQSPTTNPFNTSINALEGIDLSKITANIPDADIIDYLSSSIDSMTNKASNVEALAGAFSTLGSSLSSTGNNALASVGTILQSISVLIPALASLSAAQAVTAGTGAVAETPTLPGKIAAAATITATMISLFSTLGKLKFAEGGIVPGNNFSDGITARVSSGEMILNSSQQKKLLSAINSGNFSGVSNSGGEAKLQAETIIMAINNYGRRTGKGELIKL